MSYVGKLYQSRYDLEFHSIDHVHHKLRTVSPYPEGEIFTPISFCVQVMWNGKYLYMRKDTWDSCISRHSLVEAKPR